MESNDQVAELATTKERLRNVEKERSSLEERLKNAQSTIDRLQANLKQESDDKHNIRVELEVTKQKFFYTQQALTKSSQITSGKNKQAKVGAIITGITLLIASLLNGLGIGMILSNPPNTFGWSLIILGSVISILGTVQTALLS